MGNNAVIKIVYLLAMRARVADKRHACVNIPAISAQGRQCLTKIGGDDGEVP